MRTDYTLNEIAFLVDLAELCARHKVTLQPAGLGRRDFVGPRLHFKVDDDFAVAMEHEQARAQAYAETHDRLRKPLRLNPGTLAVTKADGTVE